MNIQLCLFLSVAILMIVVCIPCRLIREVTVSAEYRKLCSELDAIGVAVAEKAISDYGPAAGDDHMLRTAVADFFTELRRVPPTIEERILWAAQMEIARRTVS